MKKNFWKNATKYFRAFLILALAFLAIGLGTLGSVISTGDSFVLTAKQEGDSLDPSLMIRVDCPDDVDEDTSEYNLYVKKVLVHVGAVYAPAGEGAELRIGFGDDADHKYDLTYPLYVWFCILCNQLMGQKNYQHDQMLPILLDSLRLLHLNPHYIYSLE